MLNLLFKRSRYPGTCYVLYSQSFAVCKNGDLLRYFRKYFEERYGVMFSHIEYMDEKYDFHSFQLDAGLQRLNGQFQKQLSLDLIEMNGEGKMKYLFSFELNQVNPVTLTVVVSEKYTFDFADFCQEYSRWTAIYYGFSYNVEMDRFPKAYAIGHRSGSMRSYGILKDSRHDFQRWNRGSALVSKGFFRELLKENIISQAHIDALYDGVSLKDQIAEKDLGTLTVIADKTYYWKLDEVQLKSARSLVYQSEWII